MPTKRASGRRALSPRCISATIRNLRRPNAHAIRHNPRVHRRAIPRRTRGKSPQAKNPGRSDALSAQALEAATRRPAGESCACGRRRRTREDRKERGPIAANRSRAYLSTLFVWTIAEGLADANPVIGTNKAAEEVSRDRVLSDDDLRLVWSYAGEGDYGVIIRLLILTGQRREEVAAMRWSELDFDKRLWRIEASALRTGFNMTFRCRMRPLNS